MASDPPPLEVPTWLKSLPSAPEFRPTVAEFHDPIAYILKIEKEAAAFGICKIIPPLPAAPKKSTIANLNRSFAARDPNPKKPPTFTTRQQQIGFCPRRPRPVQKPVWQSGEQYTLQQFEAKAKQFERTQIKKTGKKSLSLLEIETLFWKAGADKPFTVEYANDMPGSGFAPLGVGKRWREEEAGNVGETAWNMRGVSRAKGSLLRFMKEDIPGVTSPMVYVAMMFSWFAWHAEDHELHSLNYLHMGSGKTWYGVPRDARLAFEEVVRVHGYSGEVNPLVTFAILGEKTTVMSPEVLTDAGIPCCRLVQNAGEFVVTFPGAYHSGFSHGFNCGEASNIATPEWLRFAKEAAIRRASTNYPPMVSHFQLLYALALSLCSRSPMSGGTEPRSSRLKDKMRGEGEAIIKNMFIQNVIQNNDLLNILIDKGSSCIVLPQNTSESPLCSNSLVRSQIKVKPRLSLGLCSRQEALEASITLPSDDTMIERNVGIRHSNGFCSQKGNSGSVYQRRKLTSATYNKFATADLYSSTSDSKNVEGERESTSQVDGLLDQGLLSCVTCGILSFACVAIIQPKEAATRYLMSADCSFLNEQIIGSGELSDNNNDTNWKTSNYGLDSGSGQRERQVEDGVGGNLVHGDTNSAQILSHSVEGDSITATQKGISALDLLASAYGDSSDSEGEELPHGMCVCTDENDLKDSSLSSNLFNEPTFAIRPQNVCLGKVPNGAEYQIEASAHNSYCTAGSDDLNGLRSVSGEDRSQLKMEFSFGRKSIEPDNFEEDREMPASSSSMKSKGEPINVSCSELDTSHHTTGTAITHQSDLRMGNTVCSSTNYFMPPDSCDDSAGATGDAARTTQLRDSDTKIMGSTISIMKRSDKDSSRMHVFCLEHAVEVEKQLHPIGGVHIMLLCHPDYPKVEAEAKLLAEELEIDYIWKDINFRVATEEDQERIRAALEDEEAVPMNSDWAVKLGINLYYSVSLSKSPLYSKQMPYNTIIYKAFGRNTPNNSPVKSKASRRRRGRQKKIVVAGKWCGKVWMSNQVHPYMVHRSDGQEREDTEILHPQTTDQKSKVESESELADQEVHPQNNSSRTIITYARKDGKRRMKPLVKASTKKPRCTELDKSSKPMEDEAGISSAQCGMILRSSRNRHSDNRRKLNLEDETDGGPSTRLRRRPPPKSEDVKPKPRIKKPTRCMKAKRTKDEESEYACDIEGCSMSFTTKQDLALHKRDICPVKGCGKKFFSHKYLVQHRKVHMDDRPLECPWKGCEMTFKWPWARTEHIRVHTGDRPYVCMESGCGQTFRFVSDFSRHKRKTGHLVRKGRR